jgi:hypothetical protein
VPASAPGEATANAPFGRFMIPENCRRMAHKSSAIIAEVESRAILVKFCIPSPARSRFTLTVERATK